MRTLIWSLSYLMAAAIITWSGAALATTQTGQIAVTIRSTEGAPLAGVTLRLSGQELIGGERRVESEPDGTYRFLMLPPGTYQIIAEHPEYQTVKTEGIVVHIGTTSAIDLFMEPLGGSQNVQEIVVVGTKPIVDTERLTTGGTITDTMVENIPTGRSYQSVAMLLPGITDTGGDGNVNVMGGLDYSNQYLLDGINITDPVTNTFSANFNFDAIKEVEVLTGGRDAEYGSALGGVVNIVTKSGGNEFSGDASIYYQNSSMQMKGKGEEGLDNRDLTLNLNLGGPLIQDRLWYFASIEVPWGRRTMAKPQGGNIFSDQKGNHPSRDFLGVYALGKLTFQATDSTTLKLLVQTDPTRINNILQSDKVHPDAEAVQKQGGVRVALISDTFLSEDLLWTNRLAYMRSWVNVSPMSGDLDTPGRINAETDTSTGNYLRYNDDLRQRLQGHSSLAYSIFDLMGEHQFKGGIDAALTFNSEYQAITGGEYYTDKGLDPANPNSISGVGLPYQYERQVAPQDVSISGDTVGLFVQDVWKPFTGLTVRPGLRFDSARMRGADDKVIVAMNVVSPRVGVSWDPFQDGNTSIKAGYYQYVDTGYLALSKFASGGSIVSRTYEYNPVTGQYDTFVRENGGSSGAEAKDYLKDPWNQQRPKTHELLFGVTRELTENVAVDATFTYRYSANGWEDTETNVIWNEEGTEAIGFRDGQPHYIWSLGADPNAFIRYYGMQLTFNKAFADNWDLMISYTLSKTEGTQSTIISSAFDRPAMWAYEYGYLPEDIRHMIKLDGSYKLPYGIVIGLGGRYTSGTPYNRYVYNDFFSDYGDRRAPRGEDVDGTELRLPDRFRLDTRIQWQLEELTGQRVDLILEVFNLLNARTPVEVEQSDLPPGSQRQFGDVTDRMNPLNVQLGMRYRF